MITELYNPPGLRVLGNRWEIVVNVVDNEGQPKDLTGLTVKVALGVSKETAIEADATLADQTAEMGQATAVFTSDQTGALAYSTNGIYYQVDIFDGSSTDSVAAGFIKVLKSIL